MLVLCFNCQLWNCTQMKLLLNVVDICHIKVLFSDIWLLNSRNLGALFAWQSKFHLNALSKCSFTPIRMGSNCNLSIGNNDSRGALIVLEGLDRCGKTSQSSRLLSYLDSFGHSVELLRFPDRSTNVGQMISAYLSKQSHLNDHTIHLLFSANRWEKRSVSQ